MQIVNTFYIIQFAQVGWDSKISPATIPGHHWPIPRQFVCENHDSDVDIIGELVLANIIGDLRAFLPAK